MSGLRARGDTEALTYISNTESDRREMLAAIGVSSFSELLGPLPVAIRLQQELRLPPQLDEMALMRHLTSLSQMNSDLESNLCFLGAGIYDHFRPAVINALLSRGEFATSYTPYQPEVSQGTLQAIYEYQTLICALTGMDIANASMYDAATALAEAALMACRLQDRSTVVVSRSVHPHYREVIATYLNATGLRLVEVDCQENGDPVLELRLAMNDQTACVIVQQPGFLGTVEDLQTTVNGAHEVGALAVVSVDPISLGLLKPPGEYGVDIVVGEGQSLGSAMGFGGPLLGFFACKKRYVRSFPGRIVGATSDQEGRRGYTMTLRTREQDIRRERATSNICTNQALVALAAAIYLCELGKSGLRQVADLSLQKARYAHNRLLELPNVSPAFADRPFFKEFVLRLPVDPEKVNKALLEYKIIGGLPVERYYTDLTNAMLVCVTETKTKADIDYFVESLGSVLQTLQ